MDKKSALVALIISSSLTVTAFAKPEPPPKPVTADDIAAKMQKQLELTDLQVAEVKPIIQNYLDQEKQLKLEEKKQLSHVLTGDQLYAWNFLENEPPKDKKKKF